ncbi:MAG: phospho-N-acetylmuramoyl-pentapeptide-transferase [Nitrospirae bacterium]|nr:phospho-N-acetylmuramoyl-pentapeptide-transferase [Nitrospirota bacterium]
MLASLLYSLHDMYSPLNVFRYITFRSTLAVMTALALSLLVGPMIIRYLKGMRVTQQVRDDGPQTHLGKRGTPTAGGLIIIAAISSTVLLWGDLNNRFMWITLFSLISFGAIGYWDDWLKISRRNTAGMKARYKFGLQILVATVIAVVVRSQETAYATMLSIPFFKKVMIDLGIFYVPFAVLVIVGSSNAVNLTDGLDGLAIGLVGIASVANALLIYISGHSQMAQYLQVFYLPGTGELTVFCSAMLGASLGFLWFNSHPAEVFMGDVGSLSLGGALGTLAVISKHEIVLAVVGGIFVIETVSVIIQVVSFKTTGKRVFRMAPIHHHFEQKGWPESKVIVRFWIVGILLSLVSLATLKLR